jgi:hypothetical protein
MTAPLGIHLAVGVSGAGKTYGVRAAVYAAARSMQLIVIDRMAEWRSVPGWLEGRVAGVSTVKEAVAALHGRSRWGTGIRVAIVRGTTGDIAEALEEACAWAVASKAPRGVVCSEAHRAAPNTGNGKMSPSLDACVTAWRHHRVALWLDTQRLSRLNRTITEQASEDLKLYTITGDLDLASVRKTWGKELVAALAVCAQRFAAGQKGWHVKLGPVRLPPFKPVRDK